MTKLIVAFRNFANAPKTTCISGIRIFIFLRNGLEWDLCCPAPPDLVKNKTVIIKLSRIRKEDGWTLKRKIVTEITDITEITDVTEITDIIEITDVTEITDITEITDSIVNVLLISVAERSAADRLLGLRVRIPPGAPMFVLCVVSKDKWQNVEQ